MLNLFGTTYPLAISDSGGEDEVRIEFTYGVVTKSEPNTEYIEHKSALSGVKEFSSRGCHWTVEIRHHLFKEVDPPLWYRTLIALKGKSDFTLQLHADGPAFRCTDGSAVAMFCLTQITFAPFSPTDSRYDLIVTFESVDTVDAPAEVA
jgi:hypothetical protein